MPSLPRVRAQQSACAKAIYVEQISINKPLAIEADSGAFLVPSAMQQNATSLFDATALATAIWVIEASDVTILAWSWTEQMQGLRHYFPELFRID
jgi:hypothetical protein